MLGIAFLRLGITEVHIEQALRLLLAEFLRQGDL